MQEFSARGVRIAFIDEAPVVADRGEPILLIHGFASTHAINWVFPQWVKTLTEAGRRVIAFDNRGHGRSEKFYDPAAYHIKEMCGDAIALLDHLGLQQVDVMGYSMGARITAYLAWSHPERVRSAILAGLGYHLVDGAGLPLGIAEAMEAPSLDTLTDPMQRMFRSFAEATKSDLKALAACIRGARQTMTEAQLGEIRQPALVAVGTTDDVAGDPHKLAALLPAAHVLPIPGRDHNRAVGDPVYKKGVVEFLLNRP
ncbi:alpha/beta fold hydrolase [Beijerinckia indica]|uniref:Alpha/beta hydrolase fold n=1 Tax=Beijerinckia indica subsp. indica (strain ATCC 9039 / DSM 1715 / NCIMB 8712) TaxID=395963 RepID=B2IHQ3_BEII9|nr:alpha/beta fold hydrolase [Beijerinckia indica]ACB94574.1 alpha/beta hydrolase fold [Beijerinckia indica subsp. indica ATCC 9039]